MQVCDHPFLLADFEPTGSSSAETLAASGKLVVLDKLLRHLQTHNRKVLLMSHHPKVGFPSRFSVNHYTSTAPVLFWQHKVPIESSLAQEVFCPQF